ncbi:hypothetical protein LTR96_011675 [Exophiala xenobiotica]|nr:hypothetical protein LTR41_011956 [Exophiala xenobiotica]KAK5214836.1 hypothetical protein LTR72_012054 [Exophiala xenobiotica]KAK5217350.1 hypothetical protein LTR47_011885 [Exophiala xenobiotica]KAK5242119.1 hypothetical protein LTS06_011723 [Exophiala xenobiotica]KAK5262854.1 hypothetical protein LTR96_011675 [Exophiala xenobiotica]
MAQKSLLDPSLGLQSGDHRDLLNVIDGLRSEGISHYVDLPQIIVCGDQSSGKSSVLEALSRFPFPRKDNLCTRFATEVILRRSPTEYANVSIIPGPDRTEEEKAKLATFAKAEIELGGLGHLIDEAKTIMGVGTDTRFFSSDILHVEIAGPSQPHLTLVDLPGIFQAANRQQTNDDAEAVTALVKSYMEKNRSIILAVVSAKNDFANQIVTKFARELDPRGTRTLGIITKPDTLPRGSDSEASFIDLAQNKDVTFRLGWHVVRNRDFDDRDSSPEERDRNEQQFFQTGVWAHLPRKNVGISALKVRLSRVLQDQILQELPKLLQDVERGLRDCEKTLDQLGTPRTTLAEQRFYLHGVSERFTYLAKAAVEGNYTDVFFGNPRTASGIAKRFRAVTQNLWISFAETMRTKGHQRTIVDSKTFKKSEHDSRSTSREAFIDEVLPLMKDTRGRELPGTYSPLLIADLFFEQAQQWESLTLDCVSQLWKKTIHLIVLILQDVADPRTAEEILRRIVQPALDVIKSELDRVVSRVLAPHQTGHPITYNHYFTENLQKLRQKRLRELLSEKLDQFFGTSSDEGITWCEERSFDVRTLLDALTEKGLPDMDRFACSEAIDGMMAYYKVAMKALIDDIAILAVEKCLLKKIPELLSSRVVISLSEDEISALAAESDGAQAERSRAETERKILTKARTMLRRLDQSRPSGISGLKDVRSSSGGSDHDIVPSVQAPLSDLSLSFGTDSRKGSLDTIGQDMNGKDESIAPLDRTPLTDDVLENGSVDVPDEGFDIPKWEPIEKDEKAKRKKGRKGFH